MSPSQQIQAESQASGNSPRLENESVWQEKCRAYEPLEGQPWHSVYNEIIKDVCESTVLKPDVLEVIYSPLVAQERLETFIDTAQFSFSFWAPETLDTAPVKLMILTEKERDWFEATLTPLLTDPSVMEWFGADAKGVGRCGSVGPQAGCGAKYPVWETTTGTLVYVNMLGTQRTPDDEYNIDAAHNAVHWYQDSHGYQHWDDGFLEGQATLYEIAFHFLYTGHDRKREEGARMVSVRDGAPFSARDDEGAREHLAYCRQSGPDCHHFFYFGGAMQQEKMILDFGFDKYKEWNVEMRQVRSREEYEALFESVYGVELRSWQNENLATYLVESFNYYKTAG